MSDYHEAFTNGSPSLTMINHDQARSTTIHHYQLYQALLTIMNIMNHQLYQLYDLYELYQPYEPSFAVVHIMNPI